MLFNKSLLQYDDAELFFPFGLFEMQSGRVIPIWYKVFQSKVGQGKIRREGGTIKEKTMKTKISISLSCYHEKR